MKKLVKIISSLVVIVLFSGCMSEGPKVSKPTINKNLPTPKGIKTISDITSIAFEWKRVKDINVEGFVIYRAEAGKDALNRVATIKTRFSTHYVDMNLKPNTTYIYRIATYDKEGSQSKPSPNITAKTADIPAAISFITKVDKLPRLAKIIFRPHPSRAIDHYIIERKTPTDQKYEEIAKIYGRLNAEFIDKNLEDEKVYEYRIFAVRYDGIKSKPSKKVSTMTKKLPPMIATVGATNNLAKKIIISWQQLPNEDELTYRIYASDFKDGPFYKIKEVKNKGEFTHQINEDGKVNFYKVTAVDSDGLESPMQQIAAQGSTKPKPFRPVILKAEIINHKPHIQWSEKSADVTQYKVIRKKSGFFNDAEKVEFTGITSKVFEDTSEGFQPNVEFIYQIIAIDKDGVESLPSQEVILTDIVKESK